MGSIVNVITKFQNVALITTAGAVAYWYAHDVERKNDMGESTSNFPSETVGGNSEKGHTLSGQVIDKNKQV